MAKGLRAKSRKANNSRLRDTVFGPVESARTKRLSQKLQQLAASAQSETMDLSQDTSSASADPSTTTTGQQAQGTQAAEGMDVDVPTKAATASKSKRASAKSNKAGRVQKSRKVKNQIAFPTRRKATPATSRRRRI